MANITRSQHLHISAIYRSRTSGNTMYMDSSEVGNTVLARDSIVYVVYRNHATDLSEISY
jgi:hypothetical protein